MQSLYVGTYAGIPVKIHWSFGLLIIYIAYITHSEGLTTAQTVGFSAYMAIIFFCVILHEYGHALAARRYGVKTLDIIISPIGGLARLERLPKKAFEEFVVAFAGPLVNLVLVLILSLLGYLYWGLDAMISNLPIITELDTPIRLFNAVIVLNVILFVFNLVPAFPMDGGRILRALLAVKLGRVRATKIASIIGQVLAVLFIVLAIYLNVFIWIFIGLFIFQMARAENNNVKSEAILDGKYAKDIMRTEFTVFHLADPIENIVAQTKVTGEQNFLVKNSMGHLHGVIADKTIANALKANETSTAVQLSTPNYGVISPNTELREVFNIINNKGLSIVAIKENDQLLGVIDRPIFKSHIESSTKA